MEPETPRCDIAIVGAGMAGASLAGRLAGRCQVVLLEREDQPGWHSTGRSAAMFMESYGPPMVRALTRAGRAFLTQPPPAFGTQPLVGPRGVLYVAGPGQQALLDALQQELAGSVAQLQRLDRDAALARVACLRPERLLGALHDGDALDIDVHALHQGFLRLLRQGGGTLRCRAELTGARRQGADWELQFAHGAPLRARTVVNAAGAWADGVGALFGAPPIGLQPRRRSAFTFAAPAGLDTGRWPTVASLDETWYFKPDAGVLLGSPANADPVAPHDVVAEELDIALGIDRIAQATTLSIRRPIRTWAGLRSFVPDGELVIGADARCPGLFWLAGQGGYGIQSAPGASALAAALVLGEPLPEDLRAFGVEPAQVSPDRLR